MKSAESAKDSSIINCLVPKWLCNDKIGITLLFFWIATIEAIAESCNDDLLSRHCEEVRKDLTKQSIFDK